MTAASPAVQEVIEKYTPVPAATIWRLRIRSVAPEQYEYGLVADLWIC